jgi:hypothetical protein
MQCCDDGAQADQPIAIADIAASAGCGGRLGERGGFDRLQAFRTN